MQNFAYIYFTLILENACFKSDERPKKKARRFNIGSQTKLFHLYDQQCITPTCDYNNVGMIKQDYFT